MPLIGREPELAAIDDLLGHLGDRGGTLVVRSEPGLGKSALLEEAARRAAELGRSVLHTAGVPSESRMAFAGLHGLLGARLDRVSGLPEPQADALSAAFGLGSGAAPDRFLIALAALELLADAAAEAPLVLIVEDAHWLDADSAEVLAFVGRRVELEPIAVLFAVREGHPTRLDDAHLPELRLAGLRGTDSERLLDSHAPDLSPAVRRRVLDAAGGNPLALLELPRAYQDLEDSPTLTPPPLTETLEQAFSDRLSDIPESTRSVLLVAAADDGGRLPEVLAAASAVACATVTVNELAPAEEAGLVALGPTGVRFRHPLARAAIYHAAATPARHAAHAALADAHASDPERSVWHRAASQAGYQPQVAADLQEAARRALRRGAPAMAAAALERAAQLTPDADQRGSVLLEAGEMELELGRPEFALRLLAQARPLVRDERLQARLALLVEAANDDSWSGPARVATFAELANRLVSTAESDAAMRALLTLAKSCWWGNAGQRTRDLVTGAAEKLDVPAGSPALVAVLATTDPFKRGAAMLEQIAAYPLDGGDPGAMHMIGTAATAVGSFDTSLAFLDAAVDGLREQGRLGLLAQALVSQSWAALHCANGSLALSAADEAGRLARETGQPRWAVAADLVRATLAGERGDFATSHDLADRAEAELSPIGAQGMLALVQFARGRGAVAHQSYREGLDHLRRILDPEDIAYQPHVGVWALADLVDAAIHAGEREMAEEYLATLESWTATTPGTYLRVSLAYARPLVAGDDTAEALYLEALGGDVTAWPCFRGRMLFAYGRWLRRRRRVAESRAPLRAAREAFDALAFDGLAERAREELRASGETSRGRTPDVRDQLTPQELQISQLTADGLSNREIGQRLYLSHRTVGSHLYRIFPKLGITSRGQLAAALAKVSEGA